MCCRLKIDYSLHLLVFLLLVIYIRTKKRQHYFDILKAFFVRPSSEYKTSDSGRKVNRNIYPDAVTCDRMRLIDPKSGLLEPIHHCCLVEEFEENTNLFVYTRLGFESLCKQIPKHLNEMTIIGQARSLFHIGVLESVYIKTQNPVLCRQKDLYFLQTLQLSNNGE